jgi:hypothetical protein
MANDDGEWMRDLGNSVELVENMQSTRYIKSHLTWELLPAALNTVKPKVQDLNLVHSLQNFNEPLHEIS